MKNSIIIILCLFCALFTAKSQTMDIGLKNGTTESYSLDSINSMRTYFDSKAKSNVISLTDAQLNYFDRLDSNLIGLDTSKTFIDSVWEGAILIGQPNEKFPTGLVSKIESIYFNDNYYVFVLSQASLDSIFQALCLTGKIDSWKSDLRGGDIDTTFIGPKSDGGDGDEHTCRLVIKSNNTIRNDKNQESLLSDPELNQTFHLKYEYDIGKPTSFTFEADFQLDLKVSFEVDIKKKNVVGIDVPTDLNKFWIKPNQSFRFFNVAITGKYSNTVTLLPFGNLQKISKTFLFTTPTVPPIPLNLELSASLESLLEIVLKATSNMEYSCNLQYGFGLTGPISKLSAYSAITSYSQNFSKSNFSIDASVTIAPKLNLEAKLGAGIKNVMNIGTGLKLSPYYQLKGYYPPLKITGLQGLVVTGTLFLDFLAWHPSKSLSINFKSQEYELYREDYTNPTITSVSPTPFQFKAGDIVTIYGYDFRTPGSNSYIQLGNIRTNLYKYWNDKQIQFLAPVGIADGVLKVVATGKPSQSLSFTVKGTIPPPTISSVSPSTIYCGKTITIIGKNFYNYSGGSVTVKFGSLALPTTFITDTRIDVIAPGASQTADITVTVNNKTTSTPYKNVKVVYQTPHIDGISPQYNVSPNSPITISGINFLANTVLVNGSQIDPALIQQWTEKTIIFKAPANIQSGSLRVKNQFGESNIVNFTVLIPQKSTVTDSKGNVYKTVKIGNQIWMAENLKLGLGNFRSPNVYQKQDKVIEYYGQNNYTSNLLKYGGLYQWNEATNWQADDTYVCPNGFRIPNDNDWSILETTVGGAGNLDAYGFNTQFSGIVLNKSFKYFGSQVGFWTSTDNSNTKSAYSRTLKISPNGFGRIFDDKNNGYCIRCMRQAP